MMQRQIIIRIHVFFLYRSFRFEDFPEFVVPSSRNGPPFSHKFIANRTQKNENEHQFAGDGSRCIFSNGIRALMVLEMFWQITVLPFHKIGPRQMLLCCFYFFICSQRMPSDQALNTHQIPIIFMLSLTWILASKFLYDSFACRICGVHTLASSHQTDLLR